MDENETKRGVGNPNWVKGGASPNPGGRPKQLVAIEKMLDEEFRDIASTRENYQALRKLALQGVQNDVFDKEGAVCGTKVTYHPAYMEQLFNRLYGPVRDVAVDLKDASDEFLSELRGRLKPS